MIYGSNNVHVVRDLTDLIGVRTLLLRQYWQVSLTNPTDAELNAMKPGIPPVQGGMLLMGEQTMKERGRYVTVWTFQGVNGDGKSVTFKRRGKSFDYGFEPGFSQAPIQVHADFDAMKSKFGGQLTSGRDMYSTSRNITGSRGAEDGQLRCMEKGILEKVAAPHLASLFQIQLRVIRPFLMALQER